MSHDSKKQPAPSLDPSTVERIIKPMNQDHGDALLLYARDEDRSNRKNKGLVGIDDVNCDCAAPFW